MISATFIFRAKDYDEEFFRLDGTVEAANLANPEYLGKDSWANAEKDLRCVVYYYRSMAGVTDLRAIAAHRQAKSQYSRWYAAYHVVISEVLRSYGDGVIDHPTPAFD